MQASLLVLFFFETNSLLVLNCSNSVWDLPQVGATVPWEEIDVEQGDGLPPLHLWIHCRILTHCPDHAWWKHTWCNAIRSSLISNLDVFHRSSWHHDSDSIFWFQQVMATSPRSDILVNLPALEKLETMLLVSLDSHNPLQKIHSGTVMYDWISFCRVYWTAFTSQSSGMQTRETNPSMKARNHSSEVRTNGGYLSHVSQTLGYLIACTVNCSRRETKQARSTRCPWKSTAVSSLKCRFRYHT